MLSWYSHSCTRTINYVVFRFKFHTFVKTWRVLNLMRFVQLFLALYNLFYLARVDLAMSGGHFIFVSGIKVKLSNPSTFTTWIFSETNCTINRSHQQQQKQTLISLGQTQNISNIEIFRGRKWCTIKPKMRSIGLGKRLESYEWRAIRFKSAWNHRSHHIPQIHAIQFAQHTTKIYIHTHMKSD